MRSQKGDFNKVEDKNSLKKELVCIIALNRVAFPFYDMFFENH
jgi:hypothetical protein